MHRVRRLLQLCSQSNCFCFVWYGHKVWLVSAARKWYHWKSLQNFVIVKDLHFDYFWCSTVTTYLITHPENFPVAGCHTFDKLLHCHVIFISYIFVTWKSNTSCANKHNEGSKNKHKTYVTQQLFYCCFYRNLILTISTFPSCERSLISSLNCIHPWQVSSLQMSRSEGSTKVISAT